MNRARVQGTLNLFFGRAGCVSIADRGLANDYLEALRGYLAELKENFDPLDVWSVQELEHATNYLFYNKQWISGADEASLILGEAFDAIEEHRQFLFRHGLLPGHLASGPNNSFKPNPLRGSA